MFRLPRGLKFFQSTILKQWIHTTRVAANTWKVSAPHPSVVLCSSSTLKPPDIARQTFEIEPVSEEPTAESVMEKIFSTYKSIPAKEQSPEKIIEALVQIIDLYKSLHPAGSVILNHSKSKEPTRKTREDFIRHVHDSPVVLEMMSVISQNLPTLSDDHLADCLLFVKGLKFSIREEFAQQLLEEMTRRKSTLSTSTLRTLVIALRSEYLYGCLVVMDFLPLFYSKIQNLSAASSGEEVRLVSSTLRTLSYMRCTSREIVKSYLIKISQIVDENPNLDMEALVRIIPVLFELQFLAFTFGSKEEGTKKTIIVPELLRKCCLLLEPKVGQLDDTHLQALSKFLEFQQEPVSFIHALLDRANAVWMENYNRVDLMSMVRPKSHDVQENAALLKYFNKFLDKCDDLRPAIHVAYRALKKLQFDAETYDKYWSRVNQLLLETNSSADGPEYESEYRFCDLEDSSVYMEVNLTKDFLIYAHEYLNVLLKQSLSYSHQQFEQTTRNLILKLFKDYKEGRAVMLPSDYAKAVAFLLATNYKEIEIDSNFLKSCGVEDLILINKGAEIGGNDSFILANLLSLQSANLFRTDLTAMEYIGLTKVNASFQKHVDLNPMFKTCLENVVHSPLWNDFRVGKEILNLMLATGFYFPQGLERVARIIVTGEGEVSLNCVEKFLWSSYVFGEEYSEAVTTAAKITEKYFDYIHPFRAVESALALCYHRALSQDLIKRIFDVEFIDILDQQIQQVLRKHNGRRDPNRIRNVFMSLNRAVCLDVPEANVPWFHQKYCEELASVFGFGENTTLNAELGPILESIVGPGKYVRNTYAPYYHQIDFLLHLDEDGQPQNMATTYGPGPTTKIAIITHFPKDYTLNVRQIKGPHILKKRHLEICGYRVIDISPLKWNSMYMSDHSVKKDYVKSCIFG